MIGSQPPPTAPTSSAPPPAEPRFKQQFTYQEVANLKRVTKQTVYEWVKKGMVPSPIYTGFTARFTEDQVAEIMIGVKPAGSFEVTPSPRAEIGKKGGSSYYPAEGKARNPTQQRIDAAEAKRKAAKKPAAKKPAAKKPAKSKKTKK